MYEERKKEKRKDIESGYGFWLKNTTENQQKKKKNMSQNPNDINQKISLFTISQGTYANETN